MFGEIVFFSILVLLACYGMYVLVHTLLRYFMPSRHMVSIYTSIASAFVCLVVFTVLVCSYVADARQDDASAPAEPTIQTQADHLADETQIYIQGYTDALDKYFDKFLSFSASVSQMPNLNTDSRSVVEPAGENVENDQDLEENDNDINNADEDKTNSDPSNDDGATDTQNPADTSTDNEAIVYYTQSGSVIHFDKNCSYLKKAAKILSATLSSAPSRSRCSRCG